MTIVTWFGLTVLSIKKKKKTCNLKLESQVLFGENARTGRYISGDPESH